MDTASVGNVRVRSERWCSNFFSNSGSVANSGTTDTVLDLGPPETGAGGTGLSLRKVGDSAASGFRRSEREMKMHFLLCHNNLRFSWELLDMKYFSNSLSLLVFKGSYQCSRFAYLHYLTFLNLSSIINLHLNESQKYFQQCKLASEYPVQAYSINFNKSKLLAIKKCTKITTLGQV